MSSKVAFTAVAFASMSKKLPSARAEPAHPSRVDPLASVLPDSVAPRAGERYVPEYSLPANLRCVSIDCSGSRSWDLGL